MAYETRSQGTVGGLDFPRILVICFAILFFTPFFVFALLEVFLWRRLNTDGRQIGKRWVLLAFVLSLIPWAIAAGLGKDNPLLVYVQTQSNGAPHPDRD